MCGIAGFAGPAPMPVAQARAIADAMGLALAHRGPDAHGIAVEAEGRLAFAHRRLAVIDLTATGLQPMASADGRWLICYNGEIYNHQALRRRLVAEGVALRGQSDTEVMLEWIARHGLADLLGAVEGMFAFALWDRRERCLSLARDPMGIKPLFWTLHEGRIAFASEVKALRALPGFAPAIDPQAVATYLRFGSVPAPGTILAGVSKLAPGEVVEWRAGAPLRAHIPWSLADAVAQGQDQLLEGDDESLIALVEAEILRSIGQEMIADVPTGCFLSGGVDSSLVTALMRRLTEGPLHSFTVGFAEAGYDETPHAARVAAHLGTTHHTLRVGPAEAAEVIGRLPSLFDEPISDMAAIPTALVARLARQNVTVALSGDGGDELFAGYDRYAQAAALAARIMRLPRGLRRAASVGLAAAPPRLLNAAAGLAAPGLGPGRGATRALRLARALKGGTRLDIYRSLVELWPDDTGIVPAAPLPEAWLQGDEVGGAGDPVAAFQRVDCRTLLPDTLLAKMDHATMAAGLEVRVPLLGRRLASLAFRLPPRVKRRDGQGKWILRQILHRHVPPDIAERPKQGFGIPMAGWLRGPLRDWASALLSPAALEQGGLVEPRIVAQAWAAHLAGRRDASHPLWAVLVLADWQRHWQAEAKSDLMASGRW